VAPYPEIVSEVILLTLLIVVEGGDSSGNSISWRPRRQAYSSRRL